MLQDLMNIIDIKAPFFKLLTEWGPIDTHKSIYAYYIKDVTDSNIDVEELACDCFAIRKKKTTVIYFQYDSNLEIDNLEKLVLYNICALSGVPKKISHDTEKIYKELTKQELRDCDLKLMAITFDFVDEIQICDCEIEICVNYDI